jgi:outer membrane receptor for ferric coprogen and ferric-rhodotorulic acid
MHANTLRLLSLGLLATAFVLPATALAAPTSATGTVVGSVTCGADEATPASHITVAAEGLSLQTTTDGTGHFTLTNVPAGTALTIDAVADPQASVITSRSNVVVQPGQMLDIGSMDVAVCGLPVLAPTDQVEAPADNPNDNNEA